MVAKRAADETKLRSGSEENPNLQISNQTCFFVKLGSAPFVSYLRRKVVDAAAAADKDVLKCLKIVSM